MTLQRMVFSTSIGALMTLRAGPALADGHTPPTTSSNTEMTEDFPTPVRPFVSTICSKNRGAGATPSGLGELCASANLERRSEGRWM
jgi:hypothetical protein